MDRVFAMDHGEDRNQADALAVSPRPVARATQPAVQLAYEAHYEDVFRYTLALTRTHADAEEATAEVFVRALHSWDHVPPRPLPWLLLTARRIVTDRWRRAARWLALLAHLRPGGTTDAGERRTEFWAWFDAVASVLTDRQREALVLRYQDDLTDADIGAILGLSESGVRSLVARALEVLRGHPELL